MHSNIFDIKADYFGPEDWAGEATIADEHYYIDGVDYYQVIYDEKVRCELIELFFGKYFPDKSFEIVKNEPGQTAVVKFVGDIRNLYEQWREQIQAAAEELTVEGMTSIGIYHVEMACKQPFELYSKFYQEDWNGCTVDADGFFDYLRYLDKENNGEPFDLYIGQVFDYHI